ncbi:hypothetical protein [Streptomyces profundus]|uniref:hypothetical protein n=1 Tax=Streptomyces profundus TaxID=2867410 RepID=UPI001D164D7D|nr:hypothetical protein [Streptomyces sp. MA3_2.13]UED87745.1 hypothetical protein K4G22_29055 [Streptomyces sp. MA3_2.13]
MANPQEDLSRWGLYCFAPRARRTPHTLVREQGNGALLYAARRGVRPHEFGVAPPSEERLAGLVEFGLLERRGDLFTTAFPVLGPEIMAELRAGLAPLAERTAARAAPAARRIGAELAGQGLPDSVYAIVFGYALDGLLWPALARRVPLPDTTLTPERPWWNGAFWAVYPPRPGAAGTNFVRSASGTLTMVWTDATQSHLRALARAESGAVLREPLAPRGEGEVIDGDGRVWRLRRPDGRLALPVVGVAGPLDEQAEAIAEEVVDALVTPDARRIGALVDAAPEVATVVLAHEFIWSVAQGLVASGTCPPPPSLAQPLRPESTPVDLLFFEVPNAPAGAG